MAEAAPVTGYELRILADAAWEAGKNDEGQSVGEQRELADALHNLAAKQEEIERLAEAR
jgi:hypothetical protein